MSAGAPAGGMWLVANYRLLLSGLSPMQVVEWGELERHWREASLTFTSTDPKPLKGYVGVGARAINKRLTESTSQLKEDAVGAIKISLFVLVTLLGALYVLDF